jgi:hypothetical protein
LPFNFKFPPSVKATVCPAGTNNETTRPGQEAVIEVIVAEPVKVIYGPNGSGGNVKVAAETMVTGVPLFPLTIFVVELPSDQIGPVR